MIYSLAPSGSGYATERQNGCFWLGDSWTDSAGPAETVGQAGHFIIEERSYYIYNCISVIANV